ncbi:MAG: LemA family protein [Paracoccus sp. (in: a-proteobacteria)]|nr:LemA family protein [Paracoccus sp. (in: a-proteobacteria)]
MYTLITLLLILAAIAAFGVALYNRLVSARQRVGEAWSGIDVQLLRRSDLVPNLVEVLRGYMTHEREALEAVTAMRARASSLGRDDVAGRAAAEGQLGGAIMRLMATAEGYPELKASRNFQDLHAALDNVENDIQHARRYYNAAVRELNIRVESFPSNLVAQRFGFVPATYFELTTPEQRAVPQVSI